MVMPEKKNKTQKTIFILARCSLIARGERERARPAFDVDCLI
jgi:hypothetical protein